MSSRPAPYLIAAAATLLLSACVFDLDKKQRPGDASAGDTPQVPPVDVRLEQRSDQKTADRTDLLSRDASPDIDGDGLPNIMDPEPLLPNTVLYNNTPGDNLSDYDVGGVAPATRGTDLCIDEFAGSSTSLKQTLPDDIVAMTAFTLSAMNLAGNPYAGLGFRLSGSAGSDGYRCVVDFRNKLLALLTSGPGASGWKSLGSAPITINPSGTFQLIARAVKDKLQCKVVGQNGIVAVSNADHKTGSVGFVANDVKVCFHYLVVVSPG